MTKLTDLQKMHLALLDRYLALIKLYDKLQNEHITMLKKHDKLQNEHIELLAEKFNNTKSKYNTN